MSPRVPVVAIASLLLASCDLAPPPSYFVDEPQGILFVADDENGNFQLFSILPDGSNVRQVTDDHDYSISYASWSPDRQSIAFLSSEGGVRFYGEALHFVRSDGTGKYKLDTGDSPNSSSGFLPIVWSPDSDEVAFFRLLVPEAAGFYKTVVAGGGRSRFLVDDLVKDHAYDWSDDGSTILGDVQERLGSRLAAWNADTGEELWSYGDSTTNFNAPLWSPGEDKIVFTLLSGGRSNLYLLNPASLERTVLTKGDYEYYVPVAWPNADTILARGFTRDDRQRRIERILIIDSLTGEATDISPFANVTNSPTSW
jgi:Tol biopolymer transport system component